LQVTNGKMPRKGSLLCPLWGRGTYNYQKAQQTRAVAWPEALFGLFFDFGELPGRNESTPRLAEWQDFSWPKGH
jgi:hypothetical protein